MASAAGNDVAEKAVEDIRENLRRIASAILEAQRRRKSYRAGGENRPAVGSRSYRHVGPKPGARIPAPQPGGGGGGGGAPARAPERPYVRACRRQYPSGRSRSLRRRGRERGNGRRRTPFRRCPQKSTTIEDGSRHRFFDTARRDRSPVRKNRRRGAPA